MKKNLQQLNVDSELFKKIKKRKKTIYVLQNEDYLFLKNEKVIITNSETDKKLKRKIIKTYEAKNIEELKKSLKRKSKYIYQNKIESDNKVSAVQFQTSRKIFRKFLLCLLVVGLLTFGVSSINNTITNMKNNKIKDNITNLEKEKTSYVFIEINPSLVLTVKNNKVKAVACLNDDCISFYDEIDVKDKSISDSIDNIYNLSKEKGFDVSNGVKIKTTDEIKIDKDYVSVEYIDEGTKNEMLSNVKNNEEIKYSNDNYYSNLWKELKKDEDYDKIYSCNMDNEELKCYFTNELETIISKEIDTLTELYDVLKYVRKMESTLNKFNIKYDSANESIISQNVINNIYINDKKHEFFGGYCYGVSSTNGDSKQTCYNIFSISIEKIEDPYYEVLLPISKFNLVSTNYNKNDLVTLKVDYETGELIISKNN